MVFAIYQYESAIGTHVSSLPWESPPPPHPSRLSQSPCFGCPASYVKLTLVIYFTSSHVDVSMICSQIVPPCSPPTESESLFSTSVSPFANNFWLSSLRGVYIAFGPLWFWKFKFQTPMEMAVVLRSVKDISHGFSPKHDSSLPSLRAAPWAQDERAG